jgi:histidyl-tRNA synthetase
LDYYNLTVFEFVTDQLGSQGTICGGGRYDYLFEEVGGKPAPAVGWAMGMERVLELLNVQGKQAVTPEVDVYAVVDKTDHLPMAMAQLQGLRAQGLVVHMHARGQTGDVQSMGSLKSQFKRADLSGARFALVFGQDEAVRQVVGVKNLRDREAAQTELAWGDLQAWGASIARP